MNRDGFSESGAALKINGLGPPAAREARVLPSTDPATSSPWRPVFRLYRFDPRCATHLVSRNHRQTMILSVFKRCTQIIYGPRVHLSMAQMINYGPRNSIPLTWWNEPSVSLRNRVEMKNSYWWVILKYDYELRRTSFFFLIKIRNKRKLLSSKLLQSKVYYFLSK